VCTSGERGGGGCVVSGDSSFIGGVDFGVE